MKPPTEPFDDASGLQITPEIVRDEMTREMSQRMMMPAPPHAAPNPIAMSNDAMGMLEEALTAAGASYDAPTKRALRTAAMRLQGAAEAVGTDWRRIEALIDRLN